MRSHILLRPSLLIGTLVVGSLLASVACGAADDPTAEPTATATATVAPTVATPTATAAAPPAPTPSDQPRYGGILKFEGSSDPSSFDVHNATSAAHSIHNGKMYSTLIDNVDGKSLAPGVAESWEISADGSVWTFIIRNDIRFQSYTSGPFAEIPGPRDGTILTAADAEYSLEKIMGLVDGVVSARCGWMKEFIDIERDDLGVEAVDDRTLKVYMKQPSSALANILILDHCGVMPEGTTRDMLAERAYGSGGYKLKEFQRGALWEYERNDDFFRPGLPYLDEVHHVNLRGSTVEQAAFLSGQLDMQSGLPTADNSPIYDQMAADGEIVMIPTPGTCVIQGVYMNSQVAPFDNPQLRKAVHLGIDRKGYIEAVYDGNAVPVTYTYPNTWFGYTEEEIWQLPGFRQPKDQDLAEAKRIMAEEYPSGLTVTMQARDTGNYPKMAEFITGELQKIGIEATIDIMNASQLFPLFTAWNYEIANYCMTIITITPEENFGSYFLTGGSRNWLAYSNPTIDRMFPEMAGIMDQGLKQAKIREMEDMLWEHIPYAPTASANDSFNIYSYVQDYPVADPRQGFSRYSTYKMDMLWRSDV